MSAGLAAATFEQPHLIVVNPSGDQARVRVSPFPFTMGRLADNHLVLRDSRASRNHARITFVNGEYFVEDLNSRHGVTVNGAKVHGHQRLANGDHIGFGIEDSYRLIFTIEEDQLLKLMDHFQAPARPGAPANLAKLRALVEVARTVQSSLSTDSVLSAVVDAGLTVTGADRGFLLLRKGDRLETAIARDQSGSPVPPSEYRVPSNLIEKALKERRDLLSMAFDPRERTTELSTAQMELRSVVCVPLMHVRSHNTEETVAMHALSHTLGVLYLESRAGDANLAAGDRELLETLALEASAILENARLLEQERLRLKMDEELKIAREIQQSLMPRRLPDSGWFRAATVNLPSHQVGGDYCDISRLSSTSWGFVVADVSGKGVSSALLASLLQGAFLAGGLTAPRIEDLMEHVNRFLTERTEGEKYATLFFGVMSENGLLRWSNAGHCPALLLRKSGEVEMLESTSMPLGMLEEAVFEVRATQLQPGDKLLAYSDGVSEAQNPRKQFFGIRRLTEMAKASRELSCRDMLAALIHAVATFSESQPQGDDISAVAVEYQP